MENCVFVADPVRENVFLGPLTEMEEVLGCFTWVKVAILEHKNTQNLTQVKVQKHQNQNILKVPKVKVLIMRNGPF